MNLNQFLKILQNAQNNIKYYKQFIKISIIAGTFMRGNICLISSGVR